MLASPHGQGRSRRTRHRPRGPSLGCTAERITETWRFLVRWSEGVPERRRRLAASRAATVEAVDGPPASTSASASQSGTGARRRSRGTGTVPVMRPSRRRIRASVHLRRTGRRPACGRAPRRRPRRRCGRRRPRASRTVTTSPSARRTRRGPAAVERDEHPVPGALVEQRRRPRRAPPRGRAGARAPRGATTGPARRRSSSAESVSTTRPRQPRRARRTRRPRRRARLRRPSSSAERPIDQRQVAQVAAQLRRARRSRSTTDHGGHRRARGACTTTSAPWAASATSRATPRRARLGDADVRSRSLPSTRTVQESAQSRAGKP